MFLKTLAQVAVVPVAHGTGQSLARLDAVDILVIAIYFGIVIFIGFYLKGSSNTSEEFFMAGREMTAWIAGLSFVSANLGSLELMGWAGSAYQYGILAAHWYWIGAIPAMLFLGIIMMPFYYISKTHSVPGYLHLRYGDGTRALSAVSFAFMTVLMSGINMYSMALVMKVVLGWNLNFSIWVSSITVALYVALGGLRSAIFNEVLQFILIWVGALLIPILGMIEVGGWNNLRHQILTNLGPLRLRASLEHHWAIFTTIRWASTGRASSSDWAWSSAFGYWTTDFLVVQRVLSAHNLRAARMAPIIGAAFKMAVPFIVILPGLLALSVLPFHLVGEVAGCSDRPAQLQRSAAADAGALLRARAPRTGVTALIAGFMSGMAGNVSAFSTVWTYDIYGAFLNKKRTRQALCRYGALVHLHWRARLRRHGLPCSACGQHHGLRAGALQFLHCASVRHRDPGHAVEARDESKAASGDCWRALCTAHWAYGAGCARTTPPCAMLRSRPTPRTWRRTCIARCGRGLYASL